MTVRYVSLLFVVVCLSIVVGLLYLNWGEPVDWKMISAVLNAWAAGGNLVTFFRSFKEDRW